MRIESPYLSGTGAFLNIDRGMGNRQSQIVHRTSVNGGGTPTDEWFTGIAYDITDAPNQKYSIGRDPTLQNSKLVIDATGNVGIGTTSPLAKLQVDGRVIINHTAAPGFYGQSAGTNKVYLGYDGAGTGLELYNFTSTKSLKIQDDGYLVYDGNVGIGTTTPVSALQLGSLTSISTVVNNQSLFGNNMYYTGGQTGPGVWKYITTAPASAMRLWSDGSIRFHTVASGTAEATINIADMDVNGVKMIIQNDGNVGIGTTTPASASKLQVYGTETGANWAGMGAFGGSSNAVVLGQYNNKAYLGAHNAALNAWADLAINPGGGNVGIGTTAPSVALDVNGSFKASGMPTIICPITTVSAGSNFPFGAFETKTGSISSDANSITIGETGLYLITFTLGFSNTSHGWITVNGAGRLVSWTATDPDIFTTTVLAQLNSGDVIQLFLYQGTFSTDANRKFICVTKLH
jgi:hypothetical protein